MVTDSDDAIADPTWAGVADGRQPCPACHRGLRIVKAVAAQGTTECAYSTCGAELYVRISYEWRDGRARMFADRFTLETVDALRRRHLGEYVPSRFDRTLSQWRRAVPIAAVLGSALAALFMAAGVLLPALAPGVPAAVLAGFGLALFGASVHMSSAQVVQRMVKHNRSRVWAERLLAAPRSAVLEGTEATMTSATETDGTVTGAFTVERMGYSHLRLL